MTFFNTTNETGATLKKYRGNAETQNRAILQLFINENTLSPSKAWEALNCPDVPLTSIRRAITNLTKSGHLVKTIFKSVGKYGRPEYIWCSADFYNGGKND